MVVLVQVGEEVQHRDVTRIKGAVIGGTVSVSESGDAEWCSRFERGTGRPAVRTVEQRGQLSRGRDAVYDQLVVTQPADHVEVDHGDGAVERYGTVGDEVLGAEEAHFLAAGGDEDERAPGRCGSKETRELEHHSGAGRVGVGAASNDALPLGGERTCGRAP